MKMLTAVVRSVSLNGILHALEKTGIKGMTITEIKGIGEGVQLNKPYEIHSRIEIIMPDDRVNDVTNVILDHAHTGFAGDGLIAVFPVDRMIKIRTKENIG